MHSAECSPCVINPNTNKPHMVPCSARKGGKHSEAPQKGVLKDHVCAPCDHQDAINKIKERYGANLPHLATTVAGGKDLSV